MNTNVLELSLSAFLRVPAPQLRLAHFDSMLANFSLSRLRCRDASYRTPTPDVFYYAPELSTKRPGMPHFNVMLPDPLVTFTSHQTCTNAR